MTMELGSVILSVADLGAAVQSYRDLLRLPEIYQDSIASVLSAGSSLLVLHP